jgi:hypothetical protein
MEIFFKKSFEEFGAWGREEEMKLFNLREIDSHPTSDQ